MMIAYKAFDKDLSCTSCGNEYQYRLGAVSYTHLDVYKRQIMDCAIRFPREF